MVFASFIPRLPEIRDRIDIDLATLGLLLTFGSLGGLAGSAICGPLIRRFGTKRALIGGAMGQIATLPLIGLASGPLALLLGLVSLHLFDVLADVSMNLQASWLSARQSTPVINRLHGLWSVGTVIGGLGASVAASRTSLQTHLVIVAIILAVTLAHIAPRLLRTDETPAAPATSEPSLRSSRMAGIMIALVAMAAIALEMVPADWATLRLADDLGLGDGLAGLGFVAVTSGMVAGRFSGDRLTVALGSRNLIRLAALVSVTGLAVGGLSPHPAPSIVGFALAGLGASVLFPRLYDDAAQAPGRPGATLAALTAGIRIGAFLVPVTVGILADTASLSVGAAMTIVAVPAAVMILTLTRPGLASTGGAASAR